MLEAGESTITFQRRWKNLLSWLEGHGFRAQNLPVDCRERPYAGKGLFARSACMAGDRLFVIPPRALMNKMTLKRLYPSDARVAKALTAVQLISMHLFIWRPKADEESADPFFGPHISVLPRDFDSHPLTWLVLSKLDKADGLQVSLLDSLPPSVLAALHRLHTRFWEDYCKMQTFLKRTPSIAVPMNNLETSNAVMNFLWAWLNVNTRCMYYRLKPARTDPDNLTMCPILDFANHTPSQASMVPVPTDAEIWSAAPANLIGDGLEFHCPEKAKIEEDDEIFLTYGAHPNRTLFVEYGFVNLFPENGPSQNGEVDVQDLVQEYVFTDGRISETVEAALVAEGYWGSWTLHSTPDGAQPSWRLITALRLFHLVVSTGCTDENKIQVWREVVAGKLPLVSCENEQSWRQTIVFLCDVLVERSEKSVVTAARAQMKSGGETWTAWALENIRELWREELFVARAVKESVLRGDEF